jgi:hypothetical protein
MPHETFLFELLALESFHVNHDNLLLDLDFFLNGILPLGEVDTLLVQTQSKLRRVQIETAHLVNSQFALVRVGLRCSIGFEASHDVVDVAGRFVGLPVFFEGLRDC